MIAASLQNTLLLNYLVREIEEQLKAFGLNRSKQAFRPHISLGKIPKTADAETIEIPSVLQNCHDMRVTVDQLTLYQSKFPCYSVVQTKWLERYD
jgi:2'-5' RNA ligase